MTIFDVTAALFIESTQLSIALFQSSIDDYMHNSPKLAETFPLAKKKQKTKEEDFLPLIMDLSILELDETPLFDEKSQHPFDEDLLFLPGDPFDIPPEEKPQLVLDEQKQQLVLDPFEPGITLGNSVNNDGNVTPRATSPTPTTTLPPAVPITALQPSIPPQASSLPPTPSMQTLQSGTLTAPSSPLQENRPLNGIIQGGVKAKKKKAGRSLKKEPEQKLDKLAQRKLRNKESARRYREKQVARRKQLENYTRTLTQQNRELEMLHERLLRLTCERRDIENEGIPPNVL